MGYLAVSSGADSDVTEGALSCNGVIALLDGLYIRTELDLKMLVKVKTAASDDAFGADGEGHPIFSCNRVIPKDGNEE